MAPPGRSVDWILGLLAVVVPLVQDLAKIGKGEEAVWTLVMFALLLLEINSVYQDRSEHDREQAHARSEQLSEFDKIADGINKTIDASKQQFVLGSKSVTVSLQLRVLGFGLLQNGDVEVGVFPEGEQSFDVRFRTSLLR